MPWRSPTRLRRTPGDATAFFELDDVILADAAHRQGHGEDVAEAANALSGFGFGEVVVAIPARLLRGIRDELENTIGARGDVAACADYSRDVGVVGHAFIEACVAAVVGEAQPPPQPLPRRIGQRQPLRGRCGVAAMS